MTHVLTYNGVELKLTHITEFKQEPEYTTDGADKLYDKVSISVQGIVNPAIYGNAANATTLNTLREALSQPRKALTYKVNDVTVFATTGVDAKTGPLPKDAVTYVAIMGASIVVSFSVETWQAFCYGDARKAPEVLSNRWSCTQDIDDKGYSTLSIEGTMIVRGNAGKNPDTFRDTIVPPLAKGFQRESQSYTISTDGLTYNYRITDKEVYRPAVNGITQWEGRWEETTQNQGNIMFGNLDVTACGDKKITKDALLDFCTKVALSRIKFNPDRLAASSISELLHENAVSLRLQVMCVPQKTKSNIPILTRIGAKVEPLDSSSNITKISARGNYTGSLLASALKAPCDGWGVVPSIPRNTTPSSTEGSTSSSSSSNGDGSTNYSSDAIQNPYVYFKIQSKTEEDYGIMGPLGKTSGDKSSFINFKKPQSVKIVRFEAERIGKTPDLPDPKIDDNHILLNKSVIVDPVGLLPDGKTSRYHMMGEYRYGLEKPETQIKLPKSPISNSKSDTYLGSSNYKRLL